MNTDGFFDDDNVPAWDTWIAFVVDPERTRIKEQRLQYAIATKADGWQYFGFSSYLVCWVPPGFVEIADFGIEVIWEECVNWADDIETAQTQFVLLFTKQ